MAASTAEFSESYPLASGHNRRKYNYRSMMDESSPDDKTTQNSLGIDEQEAAHCHDATEATGVTSRSKRLIIASILCLAFMVGEVVGGALAHSLAIMTDAAHLLTDFASFMISLLAIFIASRPATKRMSFGWHRAEIVGALVSVLLIWLVTGILVYMAVLRILSNDYEIDGTVMLITAAVGVGVNLVMVSVLHQHSHGHSHSTSEGELSSSEDQQQDSDDVGALENGGSKCQITRKPHSHHSHSNINVRAAFIHVIGDLLQSLGVVAAAFVIYFKPEYKIADPICTFIFSVLVLITTLAILRDTMTILMEGAPRGLDFNKVKSALHRLPGVVWVHNLRMWSLTVDKTAVSAHLAIDSSVKHPEVLRQARHLLRTQFQVHEMTIQLEDYVSKMADCRHCKDPAD